MLNYPITPAIFGLLAMLIGIALLLTFVAFKRRVLLLVFLAVGLTGVAIATVWMLLCIVFAPSSPRAWHIAIALDQLANATTGGSEDETISSRAGRLQREGRGWACILCKLLDWLQKDHCSKSIGT